MCGVDGCSRDAAHAVMRWTEGDGQWQWQWHVPEAAAASSAGAPRHRVQRPSVLLAAARAVVRCTDDGRAKHSCVTTRVRGRPSTVWRRQARQSLDPSTVEAMAAATAEMIRSAPPRCLQTRARARNRAFSWTPSGPLASRAGIGSSSAAARHRSCRRFPQRGTPSSRPRSPNHPSPSAAVKQRHRPRRPAPARRATCTDEPLHCQLHLPDARPAPRVSARLCPYMACRPGQC